MTDRARLAALPDDAFGAALRELGGALDMPRLATTVDGTDLARRVRQRIEASGQAVPRTGLLERLGLAHPGGRPVRRGLVLALAALFVVAAVAGAVGFGLPGLRIVFGPTPSASASPSSSTAAASPTPSPTPGPPGSLLRLGEPVTLDEARARAGYPLLVPADPRLGPPDAVWIDELKRVTLVWTPRPGIPAESESGLGVVLSQFPGRIDSGYFEKILRPGTTIVPVTVGGHDGYWIAGSPHEFVYVGPGNEVVYDSRRLAGDTLAWSVDGTTYRVETGLGQAEAIRIAESLH